MAAQIEASVSAEINELIESLKENPIFHMSLGSRELFHSNFLAWLSERHLPTLLNSLLHDSAAPSKWSSVLKPVRVEREKHNIDLLVEFIHAGRKSLLAVEVKVKDVLRSWQLIGYSKKIADIIKEREISQENVHKVALTLTEPSGEFPTWQVVTFQELSKRLLSIDSSLNGDNGVFIRCYREFIHDLSCLTAKVAEISNTRFTELAPLKKGFFPDEKIEEKIEDGLRLHSTFGKLLVTKLAHSLGEEAINSDDLKQFKTFFSDSAEYDGDKIFMAASGGFERGNGFTSISINKWLPAKAKAKKVLLSVGVMLQGGSYRLIITHPSFDFERGPASDEARRKKMYECVNNVQCLGWLQCEGKESLRGYAPKYIYTSQDIPMDRKSLGIKIINDLTRALDYVEKEVQRQIG
jgi:hypothetical protein